MTTVKAKMTNLHYKVTMSWCLDRFRDRMFRVSLAKPVLIWYKNDETSLNTFCKAIFGENRIVQILYSLEPLKLTMHYA